MSTIRNGIWVLIFTLIFTPFPTNASNLTLADQHIEYTLTPHMDVWKNPIQSVDLNILYKGGYDQSFRPMSKLEGSLPTHTYHWAKVTLTNNLPGPHEVAEWVMHFSLILTDIEVHAVYGDGQALVGKSGYFRPFGERSFHPTHKSNLVRVKLPPGEEVKLYIKAKSDRLGLSPVFDADLIHLDQFYEKLKTRKRADGIFIGFVLMILIYNLFLFFFFHDKAFIYYSGCLFCIVLFSIYNTGDLADFLAGSFFSKDPRLIYFFKNCIYLFIIFYLAFLRLFLRLHELLPQWDRMFKRFILWVVLPCAILEFFTMVYTQFNYDVVDIISTGCVLLFLALSTAFLYPLYRTKDKKGRFIIIGFMAMGTGILLTVFARFQSIDFSTLFFKIGTVIEIIVFSLGLVYRQREAELQRQQTSFELEKSRIIQVQKAQEAKQLEELDRMKTAFFTNITHEFRTPLTIILGMSDNIEGHSKEKRLIQKNSRNLLQMVNQLLDLSKLSAGQMEVKPVQADIVPYLRYLTESFISLAFEKEVTLQFQSPLGTLVMDFDEAKIQHIINNLLSNAIKFTIEGGKVVLVANVISVQEKGFLQIQVKDNGVGIPYPKLKHIFDRFYQAHDGALGFTGGTGIGLALTKDLVNVLGGQIHVTSEEGMGSVFTVNLPITRNAPVKKVVPPLSHTGHEQQFPVRVDQATASLDDLNQQVILVIEDNPDVVMYVRGVLQETYQVITAKDGEQGIQTALEQVPDIIISDVIMPKMNGFEVTKTLKGDERTSHIPIILLTAKATEKDKLEGLQAGADAYLHKPFNKNELLLRLENLTTLREKLRSHYNDRQRANLMSGTNAHPTPPASIPSLDEMFIKKLENEIRERMDDSGLSIEDLCKTASMSHSQLYRKLKALTGHTPIHFIRSYRLHHAQNLLLNSELNVSEIAYSVGFNDPNYFSRMYSQEFGESPTEARK